MGAIAQLLLALGAFAGALPAAADPILVSDGRQLALSDPAGLGCGIGDTIFVPSAPFAAFNESRTLSDPGDSQLSVAASQNTTVAADQMGGSGTAGNTTGTSHFCGRSTFSVTFDLPESAAYQFDGTVVTADAEAFGILSLTGPTGDEFDHVVFGEGQSQDFQHAGVLAPGEYTLYAFVDAGAAGTSSWTFDFLLVPEPATTALLALGLVSAGLRRRA